MPRIKFIAEWSKERQIDYNVPKGFLLFKPKTPKGIDEKKYLKRLGDVLNDLDKKQKEKMELKELEITLEIYYQKRTLDQNALMWALYEIEANEMNAGLSGAKDHTVNSQELYETDLIDYGLRIKMQIPKDTYSVMQAEYRIINTEEREDCYIITVILTSSKFNTLQMGQWVNRIFNRLAQNGIAVTDPTCIYDYWVQWRQGLNDNKIVLHDSIMTVNEYKSLNPICEATGEYLGNGGGHLAHINSKGMGGNVELFKNYSSNWLYISAKAHLEVQHQKGWNEFLKLYPHLRYKVETALRKEYPEIKEDNNLNKFEITGNIKENPELLEDKK